METIQKYCKRAAYMDHGELKFFGDTQKAIEMYTADNH
jgi:ABC-type polysaccharide/polyol phosphate transport system ATPase subunit